MASSMDRLLAIMRALRDPDTGCPWDVEQTHETIVPHTIEEAYEVADCIERGRLDELPAELGDLLFQVVFQARIGEEAGRFDFDDVAEAICDKLERRHPHVFGDAEVRDAEEQTRHWEALKAAERADRERGPASAIDDVPVRLPGLARAVKLQKRAARVGFDWGEIGPVFAKVREELAELEHAVAVGGGDRRHAREELGDLLFVCANIGRHLGIDPDAAVRDANAKFERRFRRLEALLRAEGIEPDDAGFDRMESAYQVAKAEDKSGDSPDDRTT